MEVKKIKKLIENILNKNKANNIVTIDLKQKSYIADYMIVASGTSSRHLQSLSENIILELKANKNKEVQDTEIIQIKKYFRQLEKDNIQFSI